MSTLLLTTEERKLFSRIPASLQESWDGSVEDEGQKTFETPELTQLRLRTLESLKGNPDVKAILQSATDQIERTGAVASIDFSGMNSETLFRFFSGLGAAGVSALIETGLACAESLDDLKSISYLTHIRHALLLSNEKLLAPK